MAHCLEGSVIFTPHEKMWKFGKCHNICFDMNHEGVSIAHEIISP